MTVPILVVDDDPAFLEVVRDTLDLLGRHFSMDAAASGGEALALLRAGAAHDVRPAFVVLDYRDVRALRGLRGVPVLMLSQFGWAEDAAAAMQAGATQFSVKPSRVRELGELLLKFWEGHAHGRQRPVDGR